MLAPSADGALFRWVAALTGSKNAVKGAGFFLGAALLGLSASTPSLWGMAGVLALVLLAVALSMPPGLPRGRKGAKFAEVFSKDARINRLSLARMFLFGARDVWFVVGIPVYFTAVLSDGTPDGPARRLLPGRRLHGALDHRLWRGAGHRRPTLLRAKGQTGGADHRLGGALGGGADRRSPWRWPRARCWRAAPAPWLTITLVVGLLAFGFVFAVNSSLHSYLILAFTSAERVTMDVGFYYMANAAGRLIGTLLSGVSYQTGGLPLCLATAGAMAALVLARCPQDRRLRGRGVGGPQAPRRIAPHASLRRLH